MKNQYVGDIGDYGKYALLRVFLDEEVKVGINWYLTENDTSKDGKFTDYLNKGDLRNYHPEIFDCLAEIAFDKGKSVQDIEYFGILSGARFYSKLLNPEGSPVQRASARTEWFRESLSVLEDTDLIFMDPDNGLLVSGSASRRGAEKYVLPEEVEEYFNLGKNVIYYCHKGRRSLAAWDSYLGVMFNRIPDAVRTVLTYHKGTQCSYVFLIHSEYYQKYRSIIDRYKIQWGSLVSEE